VAKVTTRPACQVLNQSKEDRLAEVTTLAVPFHGERRGVDHQAVPRETASVLISTRDTAQSSHVVLIQQRPRPFGGRRCGRVQSGQFGKCLNNEFEKLMRLHSCVLAQHAAVARPMIGRLEQYEPRDLNRGRGGWEHRHSAAGTRPRSSIGEIPNRLDYLESYAQFQYTHTHRSTGEKTECDYRVQLVTRPCRLGGVRWWFICPLSQNGVYSARRVGTLFLPLADKYCGCRYCYNLSYESRNEARHGRFAYMNHYMTLDPRMEKLREKTNRRTYRGRPTRNARRLQTLEARLKDYGRRHLAGLL
jgi:hypothetical protein